MLNCYSNVTVPIFNDGLIRLIRFVSRFTVSSRNAFFISSRFKSPCRCRIFFLEFWFLQPNTAFIQCLARCCVGTEEDRTWFLHWVPTSQREVRWEMALFCQRYLLLEDSHQGQMEKTSMCLLYWWYRFGNWQTGIDRRVQLNCIARCCGPNREFNARAGAGAAQGRHLW